MKHGLFLGFVAGITAFFTLMFIENDVTTNSIPFETSGLESTINTSSPNIIALNHITNEDTKNIVNQENEPDEDQPDEDNQRPSDTSPGF